MSKVIGSCLSGRDQDFLILVWRRGWVSLSASDRKLDHLHQFVDWEKFHETHIKSRKWKKCRTRTTVCVCVCDSKRIMNTELMNSCRMKHHCPVLLFSQLVLCLGVQCYGSNWSWCLCRREFLKDTCSFGLKTVRFNSLRLLTSTRTKRSL